MGTFLRHSVDVTQKLCYDARYCPVSAALAPDDVEQSLVSDVDEVDSGGAATVEEKARRCVGALPRAG